MMKIYTSYFYNVRFLQPYQIPISTAVWDPKWFHDGRGSDNIFIDKRGVINGVRFPAFAPSDSCSSACQGRDNCDLLPASCGFLKEYTKQLSRLDFDKVICILETVGREITELLKLTQEPEFVFMVYEKPDNPCSERVAIQQWFANHDICVDEWSRTNQT